MGSDFNPPIILQEGESSFLVSAKPTEKDEILLDRKDGFIYLKINVI